jgi:hypothetical protein
MRLWMGLLIVTGTMQALANGVTDPLLQLQQARPGATRYSADPGACTTRVYGVPLSAGVSPEASAAAFVSNHSSLYNARVGDLVAGNRFDGQTVQPVMRDPVTGLPKFTLVYYSQWRGGLPVYQADLRLLVRNLPGNPLVLAAATLRDLGDFEVAVGARDAVAESAAHAAAANHTPGLVNFSAGELVIWAGLAETPAPPQVAVRFVADNGRPATGDYERWEFVADAASGALLHASDLVCHVDVNGTVRGWATQAPSADICNPEIETPLPYARVAQGSTVAYADADGNFTLPNAGAAPVTLTSGLRGSYFHVENMAAANTVLTLNVTPPGPAVLVHNTANSLEYYRAEVNGYLQANVVRDFVLSYDPGYPTVSTQVDFPVNVNIDSACNAYYDGTSINMFRSAMGCANTAFANVIHHEYGHHLVAMGGSNQGAYGEGMSDCIAMLIADDPVMAHGFNSNNCTGGIRNAENDIRYPCSGEIHDCGQLLSGCVWGTRNGLQASQPATYRDILAPLTINSILLHGYSSTIAPDITIDFLVLDDDDGDFSNGTPHDAEICAGFGAHNMGCPPVSALSFDFPNGRPTVLSPFGTTVRVEVLPRSATPQPGTATLTYAVGGGSPVTIPLQVVAPNVYDAVFPRLTCNTFVSYSFAALTTAGAQAFDPPDMPISTHYAVVATGVSPVVSDAFESSSGWTVGDPADTATSGIWMRAVPQATIAQPGQNHTAGGTQCWATDARAGSTPTEFSVRGGRTSLLSPVFDLSSYKTVQVSYWLWYSNSAGANPFTDVFRTEVSWDGGAHWAALHTIGPRGPQTTGAWDYYESTLNQVAPLTDAVRFRFQAEDAGPPSLIEAALDDFRIVAPTCPVFPVGDVNCDGVLSFSDINPFVQAVVSPGNYTYYFPYCPLSQADTNHDGVADFRDINPFVSLLSAAH